MEASIAVWRCAVVYVSQWLWRIEFKNDPSKISSERFPLKIAIETIRAKNFAARLFAVGTSMVYFCPIEFKPLKKKMILSDIHNLIHQSPVVLFIKGSPEHPQCGFSRMVVRILNHLRVPFASFDVLQDHDLRENLKIFSNWPTFPQLYVKGELIGGCDIAQEMFTTGELKTLLMPYMMNEGMESAS